MRRTITVVLPVSLNPLLYWHGIRVQSLVGVYGAYGGCRVLRGCEHSRLKISFPCQWIFSCCFNAVIHRGRERRGAKGKEREGKEIKEKESKRQKSKSEETKGKTVKEGRGKGRSGKDEKKFW